MGRYIVKRLLLVVPTLWIILLINFAVIQIAPGGPVEQAIQDVKAFQTVSHSAEADISLPVYQGAQGLSPEMLDKIKTYYGFDQPMPTRFFDMVKNYVQLDFGTSFFKGQPVTTLIKEKLPVSVSLGLWSILLIYLVAIPLGIRKARLHGTLFDQSTSLVLALAYAVPGFLIAIVLIVFFAGGAYFQWFPLQGLVSDSFLDLSLWGKLKDYVWHMTLPLLAIVLGGIATVTYLVKSSFIEELNKPYVLTAQAKGLTESQVLYGHVFRNAIMIVVAALPEAFIGYFLMGNLFIEIIFNLDGLGLLGFEAVVQRDYPVIFGTLFIFTLCGLLLRLLGDVLYQWIDPRIDFNSQDKK